MFGIGLWELIIIGIVIIVFIKPKDLPRFMRKIGKIYKDLQGMNTMVKKQINDTLKEDL